MEAPAMVQQAIASQKAYQKHLKIWIWPTAIFTVWFLIARLLPATTFTAYGMMGTLVRVTGLLGTVFVPFFVFLGLVGWLYNRSQAVAFEKALRRPERITRVGRFEIVRREGRFQHLALFLVGGTKATIFLPGYSDAEIDAMVAEIRVLCPLARAAD